MVFRIVDRFKLRFERQYKWEHLCSLFIQPHHLGLTDVSKYYSSSISVQECKRRLGLDLRPKYVANFGKEKAFCVQRLLQLGSTFRGPDRINTTACEKLLGEEKIRNFRYQLP